MEPVSGLLHVKTARRASKLDEEGLEVVVCRHGLLLKALNMYRGEIFAYPLYLQKELQAATNGQFYCTDIACKYWPYLEKLAVSILELRPLLQMRLGMQRLTGFTINRALKRHG